MNNEFIKPTRVAVVGCGNVGATFAYALLISGLPSEIVMIDANQSKAEGEAMDLNHAMPLGRPTRIWAGTYEDCAHAIITVVSAGTAQRPGETRLDLLQRNTAIFKQIIPNIVKYNPNGIILIATNPVDVLTYVALKLSGLPSNQVIGSGTVLDTARFRYLLSQHFGVDPRSVHAFIMGEHGDSEVPVWSLANIAGMRLSQYCSVNGLGCDQKVLDDIFCQTRDAAYEIIERKGSTYYAIASGLLRICEAIIRNQSTVLSVSSYLDGYYGVKDLCLSVPSIVDIGGLERVIVLDLSADEIEGLRKSANMLKEVVEKLDLS